MQQFIKGSNIPAFVELTCLNVKTHKGQVKAMVCQSLVSCFQTSQAEQGGKRWKQGCSSAQSGQEKPYWEQRPSRNWGCEAYRPNISHRNLVIYNPANAVSSRPPEHSHCLFQKLRKWKESNLRKKKVQPFCFSLSYLNSFLFILWPEPQKHW